MQQACELEVQIPRADIEDLGEKECLVLDPEWEDDVDKAAEMQVRNLKHGYGRGVALRVWGWGCGGPR